MPMVQNESSGKDTELLPSFVLLASLITDDPDIQQVFSGSQIIHRDVSLYITNGTRD